ncbi:regulatory protein RecX [Christiangramia forsetii]|uniref:Regulatory protein RecX n=2 Tax=Christiangramia forsetii TaxID=411153 RepID=A0M7B2_CHRFK|nr:regulatory protein RecX [Christiangramia forsetii]GGG28277.1 recombinase RecX [Christiangramia forsetii]CAL68507.1 regulatory protein RecX [Christiangramia forsetii KT0803]
MQHNQKSYTVEEALQKLMHYCAYRDRSQKEVEDKLDNMKMIPEAKEQIIISLMQEGFLNEERFARSFVRGKFRIKKWGRVKIIQELKKRGISSPIIKLGLSEIKESDYRQTLYELAEKKLEKIKEPNAYKKKGKLADHLLRKGYESTLVFDCINDLTD